MRNSIIFLFFLALFSAQAQENRRRMAIKAGSGLSHFFKNSKGADGDFVYCYNLDLVSDGNFTRHRRYTVSGEISYIQKGGYNKVDILAYTSTGQSVPVGTEKFPIKLSYLNLSYGIKLKLSKNLYCRLAPRFDYLLNFKSNPRFFKDSRSKKDFQSFTGGFSYSIGILRFDKINGLIVELQGQNDLFRSGDKKSIGTFYNNYYGINIGFNIAAEKD